MGVYDKIKELCKEKRISVLKMETEIGFNNGTVNKWNKHKPSYDKVQKVADYFGVSVEYILGEEIQESSSKFEEDSLKKLYDFLVARGHVKQGENIPQEKLDIILSTLDNFIKLMDK